MKSGWIIYQIHLQLDKLNFRSRFMCIIVLLFCRDDKKYIILVMLLFSHLIPHAHCAYTSYILEMNSGRKRAAGCGSEWMNKIKEKWRTFNVWYWRHFCIQFLLFFYTSFLFSLESLLILNTLLYTFFLIFFNARMNFLHLFVLYAYYFCRRI